MSYVSTRHDNGHCRNGYDIPAVAFLFLKGYEMADNHPTVDDVPQNLSSAGIEVPNDSGLSSFVARLMQGCVCTPVFVCVRAMLENITEDATVRDCGDSRSNRYGHMARARGMDHI